MLPITIEDARAFVGCYEAYEIYHKQCLLEGKDGTDFVLPEKFEAAAEEMAGKLQVVIDEVRDVPGAPVFIKASSRSPKDAPATQQKLVKTYRAFRAAQGGDNSDNAKLDAMLRAGLELLKIHAARECLDLFLRSERIAQDMLLALQHKERWNENFIVRRWVDIDVSMEFRGFVHNNTLNALSQYNHLCFWPHLVQNREPIAAQICTFFENQMAPRLEKIGSYIIDFALVPKRGVADEGKENNPSVYQPDMDVLVIELNPFLETTDGCLFSWQREREVLDRGPFEFRVCPAERKGARALVSHDWRGLMDE
jgi:hypothetical protein